LNARQLPLQHCVPAAVLTLNSSGIRLLLLSAEDVQALNIGMVLSVSLVPLLILDA
jgi:hypothetical protein